MTTQTPPTITVGEKPLDQKTFIGQMQSELPRLGVQLNNRLYKIIGRVYDKNSRGNFTAPELTAIDQLRQEKFGSWLDFCQFLYDEKLIAARVTGFVPHRPRNLGSRPPWLKQIDETRAKGVGKAIRHIVPSHLLGYAVENAVGSVKNEFGKLVDAYDAAYSRWQKEKPLGTQETLALFANAKPKMDAAPPTELVARRWAWALLYNHPGNLWVGAAEANQVIGFMYAAAYGILKRLEKMVPNAEGDHPNLASPMKPGKQLPNIGAVVKTLRKPRLPEDADEDLREEIQRILDNVDKELLENDFVSISDMVSFVEDVGANLEFDIPVLNEWEKVQDWRGTFRQAGMSVRQMASFLNVDFVGSLAKPESPKGETD